MDTGAADSRGISIRVHGLTHAYRTGSEVLTVLHRLDLDAKPGAYIALTGPSGAGKTTLLSIIGGLDTPTHGEVFVGDHAVDRLRGDRLADFRRVVVGFVFQHFGLIEALTAVENVELALKLCGAATQGRRERALHLLDAVGLEERAHHLPKALSGGEKQRVAIARATANKPRLILADEPTGNLDLEAGARVLDLLESCRRQFGCTLVVVSHNPAVTDRAELRYRLTGGVLQPA